ncbi:hypothetical protein B0T20DRAFT_389597 [Sordaria brevicollis]|uniref:Uncharacterized protein n=1 Tax=Sordaria brevicollis TaxID=83679 RepID=A0AAE0UEV3_SORBR|nr:hypothetical protein B0T20DRAFT_389597 [Sordaria brevicollis]
MALRSEAKRIEISHVLQSLDRTRKASDCAWMKEPNGLKETSQKLKVESRAIIALRRIRKTGRAKPHHSLPNHKSVSGHSLSIDDDDNAGNHQVADRHRASQPPQRNQHPYYYYYYYYYCCCCYYYYYYYYRCRYSLIRGG